MGEMGMASTLVRASSLLVRRNGAQLFRSSLNRAISTSKKNDETATASEKLPTAVDDMEAAAASAKKKWMSYGFSATDQQEDIASSHLTRFMTWGFIFLISTLYLYRPDFSLKQWSQRE